MDNNLFKKELLLKKVKEESKFTDWTIKMGKKVNKNMQKQLDNLLD